MQDLDFLPLQYRQKHAWRQSQPWRIVVVAIFLMLLVAAAFSQHSRQSRAEQELANTVPQYELVIAQNRQLSRIHSRLQAAEERAELFTYLRHPWPRTRVLVALLSPLPQEISFEELRIRRGEPQSRAASRGQSRMELSAEEDLSATLPPAVRDLRRLRDEWDKMKTIVSISGTTRDSAAVHRYLGQLGKSDLFDKVELDSMEEAEDAPADQSRFQATLVVRSGYGQPGGPAGPYRATTTATHNDGPPHGNPRHED